MEAEVAAQRMVYLLEVNPTCDHKKPMTVSGNAFDPNSITLTCDCGAKASINSAQQVGLNPDDPGFQARIEELLANFTSLSYYVVVVEDGKMTATPGWRRNVTVNFYTVAECKTCKEKIGGDTCSQEQMNAFTAKHKGHDLSYSTVLDTDDPRIAKMVEEQLAKQSKK
jgi:hypothetical protein